MNINIYIYNLQEIMCYIMDIITEHFALTIYTYLYFRFESVNM